MTRAHSFARRVSFVAVAAFTALAPSPVPAQRSAPRVGRSSPRASCLGTSPIIAPARLDDRHLVYVEQETVTPQRDGRVLLAGDPLFVWAQRGEGYELVEQDSIVGVVITPPSSTVKAVVSPLRGRKLMGTRAAALPDGWWLVTFEEIVPAPMPTRPKILAMWSGETDGTHWRAVQRLPEVADSLVAYSSSGLAWRNGRALLAVQSVVGERPRVVIFMRAAGRWTATSTDVGRRSYVALAATDKRDVLAVVRPDSTEPEDNNSLFLYTRSPLEERWVVAPRVMQGYRSPLRDPVLTESHDGLTLSWRVTSGDQQSREAWFTTLDVLGDKRAPNSKLASGAELMYQASRGARSIWAITDRARSASTIQLIEHDGSATPPTALVTAASYAGLLGVAITRSHALVIASQPARSSRDPAVISVLNSYPWRCH